MNGEGVAGDEMVMIKQGRDGPRVLSECDCICWACDDGGGEGGGSWRSDRRR